MDISASYFVVLEELTSQELAQTSDLTIKKTHIFLFFWLDGGWCWRMKQPSWRLDPFRCCSFLVGGSALNIDSEVGALCPESISAWGFLLEQHQLICIYHDLSVHVCTVFRGSLLHHTSWVFLLSFLGFWKLLGFVICFPSQPPWKLCHLMFF